MSPRSSAVVVISVAAEPAFGSVMQMAGLSPDSKLPEIIELNNHPWFIGVQFHPEFKSRPLSPHPLFSSFIKAAKINSKK